jgi:hypothetical protein
MNNQERREKGNLYKKKGRGMRAEAMNETTE